MRNCHTVESCESSTMKLSKTSANVTKLVISRRPPHSLQMRCKMALKCNPAAPNSTSSPPISTSTSTVCPWHLQFQTFTGSPRPFQGASAIAIAIHRHTSPHIAGPCLPSSPQHLPHGAVFPPKPAFRATGILKRVCRL